MSFTMWAWRVLLPIAGLVACTLVLVKTWLGPDDRPADAPGPPARTALAGDRVVAEGRLAPRPGAEVTLAAEPGGVLLDRPASPRKRVKKGDLLARLRPDDQQAALLEAEGGLAVAEAEAEYQKRAFKRKTQGPVDAKQFAAEVDAARRDSEVANARRKVAAAALDAARAALARTRIISPIDGVVLACHAEPGESLTPGARLVTVCDLSRVWIEAEVDEFDAPRILPGADVTITAEGYGDASWRGTVDDVPDRVTPRTLRPDDPGRPTDTRVLLVKITPASDLPLKLGQQVSLQIRAGLPSSTLDRD